MALAPGGRVELVATDDPYTRLRVGARGTVDGIRDFPERTIEGGLGRPPSLTLLGRQTLCRLLVARHELAEFTTRLARSILGTDLERELGRRADAGA